MILSILRFIVTIVVAIFSVALHLIRMAINVICDASIQAKEATPSVVEALKVEASITADKAAPIARKVEADLRKMFKVPVREKVASN